MKGYLRPRSRAELERAFDEMVAAGRDDIRTAVIDAVVAIYELGRNSRPDATPARTRRSERVAATRNRVAKRALPILGAVAERKSVPLQWLTQPEIGGDVRGLRAEARREAKYALWLSGLKYAEVAAAVGDKYGDAAAKAIRNFQPTAEQERALRAIAGLAPAAAALKAVA